jgi:methionyl-tRNA formyltransferase
MHIVFMGTPDFALPSLKALQDSRQTVAAVITQPDRPKGRGRSLTSPPVKVAAEKAGIPVLQPQKMKDPAFLDELTRLKPDLIVVVAFGRILPPEVLKIPPRGSVNVHASLLPKYRGAAPSAWAIIQGEKQTGVTTFKLDEGMDTGDIYLQETVPILPSDTAGSLAQRLSEVGARVLSNTLEGIMNGTLKPIPQDHTKATLAPLLKKEQGELNWALPAHEIFNLVRGLDPWPGAYTYCRGDRWSLWGVKVRDIMSDKKPGTILKVAKDSLEVATGKGVLAIYELQPANARRMSVRDFLAGHEVKEGMVLGR